jgi:hypothetical protein
MRIEEVRLHVHVSSQVSVVFKQSQAMFCKQNYLSNKTWNLGVFAWIDASNVCPNETSGD